MNRIFAHIKKSITVIAILCLTLTMIPLTASAVGASDISNHWAHATIQSWVDQGFIKGYPDGSFRPENYISRAEFITLVNRVFGYTATTPITFSDVKADAWYHDAVGIAIAAGYITGYPDGTMRPEKPINREEAATILMKMENLTANAGAAGFFADQKTVSWSTGAVGAVYAARLMVGYPNGKFGAQDFIKRGEATVCLDRADKYVTGPVTPLAPAVLRNDDSNKVTGMTTDMSYNFDSSGWVMYSSLVFNALNFSGNHSLLVRYTAEGINPFGPSTQLLFTTNSGEVVNVSAIAVTGDSNATAAKKGGTMQMVAAVTPADATNKTVLWSVAPTTGSGAGTATIGATTGLLTGTGNGTVVVTATANNTIQGSSTITIIDADYALISNISIVSNNADATKAMNGDVITLMFSTDEPVQKLSSFSINGSNPDTFANVGNLYIATHVVVSGDSITGSPAAFQINVKNAAGIASPAVHSTTNGSTVSIIAKYARISDVSIVSNNADISKAMTGNILTLTFKSDEPITKLSSFKINGSTPDTFTNIGNAYTATHLVDSGDTVTGLPAVFQINVKNAAGVSTPAVEATTFNSAVTIIAKYAVISDVNIASNNASITKAKNGNIITLTFKTDEAISKLSYFKINGSTPDTFTNVGNVYTATHLVNSGDIITGLPVSFQISVKNTAGVFSPTVEATTNSSSVTIIK